MLARPDRRAPVQSLPASAAILALLLVAPAAAAPGTLEEIEACMDANRPQDSSVQVVSIRKHDRIGAVTGMRAKIYWKRSEEGRSRVLMRFSDPPDLRDAALLMLQEADRDDMWMYLPELQRVRRVTGRMMSGSMFGTDFSYEEFQRLQGLGEESVVTRRLDDAELDGRLAWVLETVPREGVPAQERPSHERVVAWIDRELCVPLQVEFFRRAEPDEEPRKRMVVDPGRVERSGDRNVPRHLEIHDLRDGTRTELEVESIELDADVRDSMFSMRALEKRAGGSF